MEMCFYTIIVYLQGNEIRNKQFSISFTEAKLKEKCRKLLLSFIRRAKCNEHDIVGYLRRIMDQKAKKVRTIDADIMRPGRSEGLISRKSEAMKDQSFLEWLIGYFTTNV